MKAPRISIFSASTYRAYLMYILTANDASAYLKYLMYYFDGE